MDNRKENSCASAEAAATSGLAVSASLPLALEFPTAIVHDWLLGMRGGEWVLAALLKLLPHATVHTLLYRPQRLIPSLQSCSVQVSVLNRLPGVSQYYRWLLPLLPTAIERLRPAADCRLVLKTSHCVSHGAFAPPGAVQVHYYFSPMRYLYDQAEAYAAGGGGIGLKMLHAAAPQLRKWDQAAAARADHVWAISHFVAERIKRVYGRKAEVIYPPVRTDVFRPPQSHGQVRVDEDLLVSALVPYKRVDLAIEAANRLRRPLRIVGDGPMYGKLRRLAGPTVIFEGRAGEARLIELYQTRRMLLFPGIEDFGIVPLEAMACGMPVLALRAGGLLETLPEGKCGEFFDRPTADGLAQAWEAFKPGSYPAGDLRANAERFSEDRFLQQIHCRLTQLLKAAEESLFITNPKYE